MIRMFHRAAIAALGLGLACLPSARADVIFNDFGTGDAFQGGTGLTIAGAASTVGSTDIQGATFTAGVTANLGEIDVAFFYAQGSGKFNLGLYADDGQGAPGTLLESIQAIGPAPAGLGELIAASSSLHPLLTAGTNYWLIASPSDPASWVGWNFNSAGATGTGYLNIDGDPFTLPDQVLPTFRLIGASVPEPSSMALLGLGGLGGLAAVAGLRRRLRPARA